MLSPKLAFFETKMCDKRMAITCCFKDELQSFRKDHYASN